MATHISVISGIPGVPPSIEITVRHGGDHAAARQALSNAYHAAMKQLFTEMKAQRDTRTY